MWRVDTPAVPRSLGGGGCGATAAAPLVGIFGSTPEAGVCFAGPGVCGSGRVTGEVKVTLAGSWRVGLCESTPDAGLCVCGPELCGSVRAKVEANLEGSCRGDHRAIVVVAAYGRNGEASAELLWSVGDPRTVVVGLAVGRADVASAFGRRLWKGESSCLLVCVWGDVRTRRARLSNIS